MKQPLDTGTPLAALAASFRLHLLAERRSPATIDHYMEALRQLDAYALAHGWPRDPDAWTRAHLEAFLADLHAQWKVATVAARFRSLRAFFAWAVTEEEDLAQNPMEKMKPPASPLPPIDVPSDADIGKLLKACGGNGYEERRDAALIRSFIDTGMRLSEVASLTVAGIDLEEGEARVIGKGKKERPIVFNRKCIRALDRYIKARARHAHAGDPALWLGRKGPLSGNGIYRIIQRRANEAGIQEIHPHQFRHYWAHTFFAEGGQEQDAMTLAGWSSRDMLARYGASLKGERARAAARRIGVGDRV